MRAEEVIRRKRDGKTLSRDEIRFFVHGISTGEIADYQASALLMAITIRGMGDAEQQALTEEMLDSGETFDFSDIPKAKVDKHSTGGVGDKTSLIVAPLAAAAGLCVPMISGRALGHTGGTLDKLETIPGLRVDLPRQKFRRVLESVGCAMAGQTEEIAPVDRKLYALRDVTATVESIPLIAASIMSKKLAEGLNGLVLDVKTGSGAFMKSARDARLLARALIKIGTRAGVKTLALITDMNQPLGQAVGNSLEVIECFETLQCRGPKDLTHLSVELVAQMLVAADTSARIDTARKMVSDLLGIGAGFEKFREMIAAQGGDSRVIDDYSRMPRAGYEVDLVWEGKRGFVTRADAWRVGLASMFLGAGRERAEDKIDPAVGLVLNKKVGDFIRRGEPLVRIHFNDETRLEETKRLLRSAFEVSPSRPGASRLIKAQLSE